jgi:hypothetical protein
VPKDQFPDLLSFKSAVGPFKNPKLLSFGTQKYVKSSLVNTPQKYKETPLWQIATEKCNLQNKSDWAECPFA